MLTLVIMWIVMLMIIMLLILGVDWPALASGGKNENPPPSPLCQVPYPPPGIMSRYHIHLLYVSKSIALVWSDQPQYVWRLHNRRFQICKKIHTVPKIFCDSSNVKKLNFSCYKTPIFQFQVEIAISLILNLSPWTLIIKFILLTNIVFFVIKTDYQDEFSGAALLREILAYECPQQVSCSLKVVMVMMRMMMVTMMVRYFYSKQDGSTPPSPSKKYLLYIHWT